MILAAAIKIKNKDSDDNIILCGANHGKIYDQIKALNINNIIEEEEGFIDQNNEFYSREAAYYHAAKCGQLSSKIIYERQKLNSFNLISEDLW